MWRYCLEDELSLKTYFCFGYDCLPFVFFLMIMNFADSDKKRKK